MSNKSRNQASRRHAPGETTAAVEPGDHAAWESEREAQRSREQAMAMRSKATRTQMPVGQTKVQRIFKGNAPKG
jgi:hypothetical protein